MKFAYAKSIDLSIYIIVVRSFFGKKNLSIKVMLHETIGSDEISATKCCNLVATLFRMLTTLLQQYNAVLR